MNKSIKAKSVKVKNGKMAKSLNLNLSLKEFQQSFLAALLDPDNKSHSFSNYIQSSPALDALQHLAIYQQSYIARLEQCMATQFSVLKHSLGGGLFHKFCSEYLRAYPSNSYTLNNLGERFAKYLQITRPDDGTEGEEDWPSFIIELAEFEYLLTVLFDRHHPNEPKAVSVDTPDDQLTLNPIHQICLHQYPISRYFNLIKNSIFVDLPLPEEELCIVYRYSYQIGMMPLQSKLEVSLMNALKKGRSWQETVAKKQNTVGMAEIEKIKVTWIEFGLLTSEATVLNLNADDVSSIVYKS